ncbi:TolC family protein [Caballeronia sp. LZ035]|uniref:TolC family protein n=1 Tax=Caballeronia sp. LZ035 TaxID=3038568 RepID=UPI0028613CD4|nr:TolC family protein [Caballeronia sp. LZ035]MDR5757133.1 TolC family protein [Caballeronia sp. LZ035]
MTAFRSFTKPSRVAVLALACACALSACTWYAPQPLNPADTSTSLASLERVRIDPQRMPLPELKMHRFDPSDGLDIEEVAMLAVANNPDLKLARDDLHIAQAQAFAAGLLPDPQLSIASDYPGTLGTTRAFSYGLSMDVMAIVTRAANKASADAGVRRVDLGLLWQEWQVIAQARQLFLRARMQDETLPLLRRLYELSRTRYERMMQAAREGNLTADATSAALLTWSDTRKQLSDAERAAEQTHHDLNLLLGVSQDVRLNLVDSPDTHVDRNDDVLIDIALDSLPRRRPDLLALKAGYQAQEEKYRAAILSQFPSLSVGFNRGRDTSNIYTTGFQINLTLPVFNRNRGNVAIESATRTRLRDEYQMRLNQAYADAAHVRADCAILLSQLDAARRALPDADATAHNAQRAFDEHDLTLNAYTDAQSAALLRRIDIDTLAESYAEQRVALQAVLGNVIPAASDPTPHHAK